MEDKTLFEIVNEVEDEKTFLRFIEVLKNDRIDYLNNKEVDEWKNDTIESFLDCAHEWAETSKDGLRFYDKPSNPWKRCAQIIYMGKIYE